MTDITVDVGPPLQTVRRTYTWLLTAFQQQGQLWLGWSTDSPFRAQQGQISVYESPSLFSPSPPLFPPDPTHPRFPADPLRYRRAWKSDTDPNPWNTGLPYRSGWNCAWIAQKGLSGPYVYAVNLVTA